MSGRRDDCIPMDKLENGRLYRIDARNAGLGVWDAANHELIIARFKWHPPRYLFGEVHWDHDTTYGTAQPYEALPETFELGQPGMVQWLEAMMEKYKKEET